ncbi:MULTISPECIES: DUF975 family protein [unclassified Enterococcus]|uniref:DUF975 family protein n=1 Tax=unclassified Enterococcus TaxID=2608891 RepID=UPI0013EA4778|nr:MULTISPECIES: DUF975 family protein [unclassified Enterococcus]
MVQRSELKQQAKDSLRGRWRQAILLNFLPTLIDIIVILFLAIPIILFITNHVNDTILTQKATNFGSGGSSGGGIISGIVNALFMSGISWTYLDVLRGCKTKIKPFKDAFRGFEGVFIGGIILLALLTTIFISLWGLLLIIPGIVKFYSYSQTYFIYYDKVTKTGKKLKVLDTITMSRRLMDGHKWQLFMLDLSFIGWHILAIVTLGIGYLWLNPYIAATKAAFYEALPKNGMIDY